ncbi:hypothetical protein J7K19_10175 [bacterium]|nr:hypothetical protein [bacterium]
MMKRRKIKLLLSLTIGGLMLSWAVWSWAQPPVSPRDTRQWLQQLDQKLEFLRELSKVFPTPKLLDVIHKIEYHRNLAVQANNKQEAVRQLQIAHKLADIAIKMALDGPVQRLRENLDELIRQVEKKLQQHFNAEAERLLHKAKDNRKLAITAYKNQNYRKAVELFRVAIFLVQKTQTILKGHPTALTSTLDEEKANFKDLLQKAQRLLDGKRDVVERDLLRQALAQQQKAERSLARNDIKGAINHYRWATRLLLRIISMVEKAEQNMQQIAANELQLTRELLQAGGKDLSPSVSRIYKKAEQVYRDAEIAFQNRKYSQAAKKAQVARRLLHRSTQIGEISQQGFDKRLEDEIAAVRHLLESLRNQATTTDDKEINLYYRIAQNHLQFSQRAFDKGNYRLATVELLVAARMSYSLQSMLSKQGEESHSAEFLAEKISTLEQQLEKVNLALQQSQQSQLEYLSRLAQQMLQTAKTSMANRQWHIAWDSIQIASQLLQKMQNSLHTNSE